MQADPARLPDRDWTVLVQEVDRHIPAVADLWDQHFSFVPSWRRDDVMVSDYDYECDM
jgi:50S ribosomal protein L16 3-hydroxylase